MRSLPLYPSVASLPVEAAEPLAHDPACQRCQLHARPKVRVCLDAEHVSGSGAAVEPGGLLVVGEAPGQEENVVGRPFVGKSGKLLRAQIQKYWRGPHTFDNAARCFPGKDGLGEQHVAACRGFLASTLREVRPSRILAVGAWASYALTGRALAPLSTRRAYSYLSASPDVPVFFTVHPAAALRNRIVARWWQGDVQWALTCPPPKKPPVGAVVHLVEDAESALEMEERLREAALDGRWFAFDCETSGWMFTESFKVVSLSVCVEGEEDSYVWTRPAIEGPAAEPLRRVLADPAVKKVGQNVKYDCLSVRNDPLLGVEVRGVVGDTRLWRKLQFSDADADLETMAELVGMGGHKSEAQQALREVTMRLHRKKAQPPDWADRGDWDAASAAVKLGDEPKKFAFGLMPFEVTHRYCARDSVSTARLASKLERELSAEPNVWRAWQRLVLPGSLAIQQVEQWGVHCDYAALTAFQKRLEGQLGELSGGLAAHGEFNPKSPLSVAKFLYEELGLPVVKATEKGNPSTDEEALEAIKLTHPVVSQLMEFRRLTKLYDTYAKGLVAHIRPDGRIHASFHLDGARSGRISCSDPNLQNVPRPTTPDGRAARDCYSAPDGYELVECDFSQLELRIAAMLSGDALMRQIYAEGVDYHLRTARMVSQVAWGVPPEAVTKDSEYRAWAKIMNFQLLYGGGDDALAAIAKCTKQQAAGFRKAIFGAFRTLASWIQNQVAEVRRTGVVWTWWEGERARCRSLYGIHDQDEARRVRAEHGAYNSSIQGTASDYCLASVAALVQWIQREKIERDVKLVLTVHDSILFEVRSDIARDVAIKAQQVMTSWYSDGVPLVVDVKRGPAWGSLKEYDPRGSAVPAEGVG